MAKKERFSRTILVLDILACVGALLFILALALNVHNRQDIVRTLQIRQQYGYGGNGVGSDAPLQYPFVGAIVALLIGMWARFRTSHPKWSPWMLVAVTALVAGFIVWAAGLSLETQNQFFTQIGT